MNVQLVSFADSRLSNSAERFAREAAEMGMFDAVSVYSERDLSESFRQEFSDALQPGVRGFGYWVWKPWVIQHALSKLNEGDILIYADVGFRINAGGKKRLSEYIDRVQHAESAVLGFQANRPSPDGPVKDDGRSLPVWYDKYWTKGDLIDYFGVRDRVDILDTPTIQAGLILLRKSASALSFVNSWLEVFRFDFSLVDDSDSKSPNVRGFREHRHDQPVFSILGKLNHIETVSSNEFWMPKRWASIADWDALSETPFHANRDLDFGDAGNKSRQKQRWSTNLSARNIGYNFVLLAKRCVNLFKPVQQRVL